MDPFDDDDIAQLLRLKRYEQPPPDYFENFLHEFHRRQRDELFRQPLWRSCFERVEGFALWINIRSLAPAGIAVLVASVSVFSIRLYQQPGTTQLAVQGSPIPSKASNAEKELDFAPPEFTSAFDTQPAVLSNSKDIRMLPVLPADPLPSDEFVPLNLEWESLDDR